MPPKDEIARRLQAIRERMSSCGLDLLLIYSQPGSMRFGQRGHVLYASGYEPYFGDTMVLLPRDERIAPLLEIDAADHHPRLETWFDNVRPAGDHVGVLKDFLGRTSGTGRPTSSITCWSGSSPCSGART
jgi:hypothetical protein